MKTIVLISSGQPSVNPRLVKEANILSSFGYKVYVIYSFWTHWAWEMDKKLFSTISWTPILAGGSPYKNKFLYLCTRLRFKTGILFGQSVTLNCGIAELAKGRATREMLRQAKSIKASIYIAHNLAALPVAVKAAKANIAKCGFDAEDFHRQEVSDSQSDFNYVISKYVEDKYLNQCDYVSAASPLIALAYKHLYQRITPILINNVFESKHIQTVKINRTASLKLFWFSQTIGQGRGIEDVISALNILNNDSIELHLLGSTTEAIEIYFRNISTFNKINLKFHKPIQPDDIFRFSNQFDIGLALEKNIPLNRDICLTNKIFSYLISGLAIITSDTTAQKAFIEENEGVGFVYSIGNSIELAKKIDLLFNDKSILNNCKIEATKLAQKKYNWELESSKFINTVDKLIN